MGQGGLAGVCLSLDTGVGHWGCPARPWESFAGSSFPLVLCPLTRPPAQHFLASDTTRCSWPPGAFPAPAESAVQPVLPKCARACVCARTRSYSTQYSRADCHPSSNQAQPCLAPEIRQDRARSAWHGPRVRFWFLGNGTCKPRSGYRVAGRYRGVTASKSVVLGEPAPGDTWQSLATLLVVTLGGCCLHVGAETRGTAASAQRSVDRLRARVATRAEVSLCTSPLPSPTPQLHPALGLERDLGLSGPRRSTSSSCSSWACSGQAKGLRWRRGRPARSP